MHFFCAGLTLSSYPQADYSVAELGENYSISELKDAGYSAREIKQTRKSTTAEMLQAGFVESDWKEMMDEATGTPYYYSTTEERSSWTDHRNPPTANSEGQWEEKIDAESGHAYWIDRVRQDFIRSRHQLS